MKGKKNQGRGYGKAERTDVIQAARLLEAKRTGIVLSGRVVNGKVELDQDALDEVSRSFPDAEISFIAVNAPFDPRSGSV